MRVSQTKSIYLIKEKNINLMQRRFKIHYFKLHNVLELLHENKTKVKIKRNKIEPLPKTCVVSLSKSTFVLMELP